MIRIEYLEEDRETEILMKFGLGWSWFIAKSLMITFFLLGTICTFTGFGTWVWYQGFQNVAIVVTTLLGVVGGFSVLLLLLLIAGM